MNKETIVNILKPFANKLFELEYINQISKVANTFHSYLIQVWHMHYYLPKF